MSPPFFHFLPFVCFTKRVTHQGIQILALHAHFIGRSGTVSSVYFSINQLVSLFLDVLEDAAWFGVCLLTIKKTVRFYLYKLAVPLKALNVINQSAQSLRSLWPKWRSGAITSRSLCLSTFASGKPPSCLRSQILMPSQSI